MHLMKGWMKEPLLHFLVAGAALFGIHAMIGSRPSDDRIVHVTSDNVEWLRETWARQRQRPPDEQELKGLVAEYVREELLCREARELGLDENDTLVRRRLAQKMEFLVKDTTRAAEPTDEELLRFYEANRERFLGRAQISFTQILFNPDRGGDTAARATEALAVLSRPGASADTSTLGDPSLLERELAGADETTVSGVFGPEFARQLFAVEPGRWCGPFESGYGLHIVRVAERGTSDVSAFADVRDRVLDEWRDEHEQAETEAYFAELMRKYDVVADDAVRPLVGALVPAVQVAR